MDFVLRRFSVISPVTIELPISLFIPGVQETFGLVALESQACGTPVVGIRGSYMDRIICHDQKSWAQENSPEALADAIEDFSAKKLSTLGEDCGGYNGKSL